MKINEFYDWKLICQTLLIITSAIVVMMPTDGWGYVVFVPFALASLFMKKPEWLLFHVFFANAVVIVNPYFMPKGTVYSVSYRAMLAFIGAYGAMMFLSVRKSKMVTPLLGVLIYIGYMVIPSSFGWAPIISHLKIILFLTLYMALAFAALMAIAKRNLDMRRVRSVVLGFAIFFVVGSVFLIPFPSISMMNAKELLETGRVVTSLFKGMTNHSQTMGMLTCFLVVFLVADWVLNIQKIDLLYVLLFMFGFWLIVKSSSRTAMGTLLVSCLFAAYCLMKEKGIEIKWKNKVIRTVVGFMVVFSVAALLMPGVRQRVVGFVMKYGEERGTELDLEKVTSTRAHLTEEQMYNFRRRPAIGWGFQVTPEVADLMQHTDGIPLTAPVEKGVWVTAILEEGGVIGEVIYCLYALIAFCLLMKRKAYMGATIFFMLHVSNLGEMTMFSMSGVGGMLYTLLFFGLVFDAKRIARQERFMMFRQYDAYLRPW